jgi:hypothetical protein
MAFHLYLAGGDSPSLRQPIQKLGCDRLFSQLNDRRGIKNHIEHLQNGGTGRLFIDSGAYTAHTKGTELDVDEYINYLNEIEQYCEIYAQVDYIPGVFGQPKSKEDQLSAPEKSWENYNYMRPKMSNPDKLLPVYHQGEDIKWLKTMLETTFDGQHVPYIGLSCSKDISHTEWPLWFDEVFHTIKTSSNPNVKTHAFGVTSLKYIPQYPFTSSDSTSWLKFAAYGVLLTHQWGNLRISDRGTNSPEHIVNQPPEAQKLLTDYIESKGFTLDEVINEHTARSVMNAIYYKDWVDNFEYAGRQVFKNNLFEF